MRGRVFASGIMLMLSAVPIGLATPAANGAPVDNTEAVVVRMPFSGKWAYWSTPKDKSGSDKYDSHPAYHARYDKDWTTDLYAPAGTPVYLDLSGATGKVTYGVTTSNTSCGAGKRVRVTVTVDGKNLGYVQYEHLDIAGTKFSDGVTNNEFLGKVRAWGYKSCYRVNTAAGVHVHFGVYQNNRYSCWSDYGKVGTSVRRGEPIGILGSNNTSAQKACAPGASVSSYRNHIVQWSGDTKAQRTAWRVGGDSKRYWIPSVSVYNCLKGKGVPGPVALPSKVLSLLTDRTGYRATC